MVAAIATIASMALPPSAKTARPASAASACGAAATPTRCPALQSSAMLRRVEEAAPLQQRLGARQTASEFDVELSGVARTAGRQYELPELARRLRIEDVAGLLERRERVGIE